MRPRPWRRAGRVLVLSLGVCTLVACESTPADKHGGSSGTGAGDAGATGGGGGGSAVDPVAWSVAPVSCAYECPLPTPPCPESSAPYACQNLGSWGSIPHATTCEAWDGGYPAVAPGKCTASTPSGDAAKYAGADPSNAAIHILPDGRRVQPFGMHWVFDESDLQGGLTTGVAPVAGTNFVLTVDTGTDVHAVRVVDTTLIGNGNPVVSYLAFPTQTLNSGLVFIAPDLVYVAMDGGVLHAMSLDTATGAIALDPTRDIQLPAAKMPGPSGDWYAASLAVAPDGKHLLVSPVFEQDLLIVDVDPTSPTVRTVVGSVNVGSSGADNDTFLVAFDPNDPTGTHAYVTMWYQKLVLELDVTDPTAPAVTRSWPTDDSPEGMAFLDARWLVVADDLGDSFTLVDRVAGTHTSQPVAASSSLRGFEPSTLAFDPTTSRLYVTLAGMNAVEAWDVDATQTPPALTLAGRLPTSWWPGGLTILSDGSIVVVTLRGFGSGPSNVYQDIGDSHVGDDMRGAIALLPSPTAADLSAQDAVVASGNAVSALAGAPAVTCPSGADDFPLPATNTAGPSKKIDHVFFIVRENKDFDGVLGDLPNVNGDPALTLKTTTAEMDELWPNTRALAKTFALSDNYYTDAVFSTQGHTWTMYGRTDDFNERTWAVSGAGRNARKIPGIGVAGWAPEEGSLFDWLDANKITWNEWGELVGLPLNPADQYLDNGFPGGTLQNLRYSDTERACYLAGRLRVRCDLGQLSYVCLPNDHTFGIDPDTPTPESCVATNDEGTGLLLDAITHSPQWASSLVVLLEDDASQGGEHVDQERSIFVLASPWVKRGYVSKTHIDGSSVHKIFAHLFGIPYENELIQAAALPLDMFTSTPDYTPYTYTPRKWPLECGTTMPGMHKKEGEDIDDDVALDHAVSRWMRSRSRPR